MYAIFLQKKSPAERRGSAIGKQYSGLLLRRFFFRDALLELGEFLLGKRAVGFLRLGAARCFALGFGLKRFFFLFALFLGAIGEFLEAVHAPGRIDGFLLAGVDRVACGADFRLHAFLRRAYGERCPAGAGNGRFFEIRGMDAGFHKISLRIPKYPSMPRRI